MDHAVASQPTAMQAANEEQVRWAARPPLSFSREVGPSGAGAKLLGLDYTPPTWLQLHGRQHVRHSEQVAPLGDEPQEYRVLLCRQWDGGGR